MWHLRILIMPSQSMKGRHCLMTEYDSEHFLLQTGYANRQEQRRICHACSRRIDVSTAQLTESNASGAQLVTSFAAALAAIVAHSLSSIPTGFILNAATTIKTYIISIFCCADRSSGKS